MPWTLSKARLAIEILRRLVLNYCAMQSGRALQLLLLFVDPLACLLHSLLLRVPDKFFLFDRQWQASDELTELTNCSYLKGSRMSYENHLCLRFVPRSAPSCLIYSRSILHIHRNRPGITSRPSAWWLDLEYLRPSLALLVCFEHNFSPLVQVLAVDLLNILALKKMHDVVHLWPWLICLVCPLPVCRSCRTTYPWFIRLVIIQYFGGTGKTLTRFVLREVQGRRFLEIHLLPEKSMQNHTVFYFLFELL